MISLCQESYTHASFNIQVDTLSLRLTFINMIYCIYLELFVFVLFSSLSKPLRHRANLKLDKLLWNHHCCSWISCLKIFPRIYIPYNHILNKLNVLQLSYRNYIQKNKQNFDNPRAPRNKDDSTEVHVLYKKSPTFTIKPFHAYAVYITIII